LIELGSSGAMEIMEASFPFALLVLMNSVFFVVWIFIGYLLFNATRGDLKLPMALLGYRMDIEKVKDKHVWLMENVEDGRVSIVLFPKKENKDDVEALKELGKEKVWVTPKIPFMVPMTVGFIGSVVLGNIFLGILILLG
jgi:preflagellin peptidase FlaK